MVLKFFYFCGLFGFLGPLAFSLAVLLQRVGIKLVLKGWFFMHVLFGVVCWVSGGSHVLVDGGDREKEVLRCEDVGRGIAVKLFLMDFLRSSF